MSQNNASAGQGHNDQLKADIDALRRQNNDLNGQLKRANKALADADDERDEAVAVAAPVAASPYACTNCGAYYVPGPVPCGCSRARGVSAADYKRAFRAQRYGG